MAITARRALLLLLPLLPSCGPQVKRAEFDELNRRVQQIEQEMQNGFSVALCTPEVKQLLEDVKKVCPPPQGAPGSCTEKPIHMVLTNRVPEYKGHLLKFMTFLRHEVAYISPGATQVSPFRQVRLARLARQPLLRNTQFMVVAHPVRDVPEPDVDASHRAEVIIKQLIDNGVSPERIYKWIYAFPVDKTVITSIPDQRRPGEPGDLHLSVWVFRADC